MPEDVTSESPVFFDTNVLFYLFDRHSHEKQRIAASLFKKHQADGSMRLSMQVVHEFAANLLSKKFGVPHLKVMRIVKDLLDVGVMEISGTDTLMALEFMGEFHVSFWDALILATARREGCQALYSEDFQHGRVYDSVRVINPFIGRS